MYYDAIDLLKGMISRPSFSREEGEVADFLKKSWEKAGYKVNRKGNNLWLIAPGFDLDKPTLLLNSHIDTVKPASGWTKDPFKPEEAEDERLYGLGSNDARRERSLSLRGIQSVVRKGTTLQPDLLGFMRRRSFR